jgi:WD40 repeat protein
LKSILFLSFAVFSFLNHSLRAQAKLEKPTVLRSDDLQLKKLGTLPKILKEASGLEVANAGELWTHNDDRQSILYRLDTTGNIRATIHLNHPNRGWEDLTMDKNGTLYIGSFGNNKNNRKDLAVYKIPTPDSITQPVYTAGVIRFSYPDQHAFPPDAGKHNFDVDAFVSKNDSLYLFTKNRTQPFTGYTRIYRLPDEPGDYEAEIYDSLYLGTGPMIDFWVTSADLSPDGKWLALLSHQSIWLVTGFQGQRFSSGHIFKINLNHFSHKTGLCFKNDRELYIVDELELGIIGGSIYSLNLTPVLEQEFPAIKNN